MGNISRRIIIVLSAVLVSLYLVVGRNELIDGLERHAKVAVNPYYSDVIDLSKKQTYTWEIKKDSWSYEDGQATLLLTFHRPAAENNSGDYWEKSFPLKVKVSAHAVTENGVVDNRLMLNYFYPTKEPMSRKSNIWAGWGDEGMEYPLGIIMRFPKEDLFVELTVENPDDLLSKAEPKLKLVGDYDPGAIGFIPLAKIIRDIGLLICLAGLLYITILAIGIRKTTQTK